MFTLSTFALESLVKKLGQVDVGIAVLGRDDKTSSRGKVFDSPRDNVVLELGMMLGRLGPRRSFVIAPKPGPKIPTDLLGWTIAFYDPGRTDRNLISAVAPACHRILDDIGSMDNVHPSSLVEAGSFTKFNERFGELFVNAHEITLCFIHSRRWREMHDAYIKKFLEKPKSFLRVFLPDFKSERLRTMVCDHFEDGPDIPGFVADAYRYFAELREEFPRKVDIRLFTLYPTYSYYRFDDTIIVAMYPVTAKKFEVPTFELRAGDRLFSFFEENLKHQLKEATRASVEELRTRMVELRKGTR